MCGAAFYLPGWPVLVAHRGVLRTGAIYRWRRGLCRPYYSLGYETYTQDSILWGQQTSRNVMGRFTLPNRGTDQRAYVTYKCKQNGSYKSIIDSWLFCTHQNGWWEYPVRSASSYRKTGSNFLWDEFEPFHTIISQMLE